MRVEERDIEERIEEAFVGNSDIIQQLKDKNRDNEGFLNAMIIDLHAELFDVKDDKVFEKETINHLAAGMKLQVITVFAVSKLGRNEIFIKLPLPTE